MKMLVIASLAACFSAQVFAAPSLAVALSGASAAKIAEGALTGTYVSDVRVAGAPNGALVFITFQTSVEGVVTATYSDDAEHEGTFTNITFENLVMKATWTEGETSGHVTWTFEDNTLEYFGGSWGVGESSDDRGVWSGKGPI